ncbi:MAG TPA: CheR family methyltransferase [Stellaceae bacterium]|jgi:chemotaxis protein methyltransferase CheR|nr:CheR family methyltransferase [Stellaceae bacterium]
MICTTHAEGVERFRAALASSLGLQFETAKSEFLADLLTRRLRQLGETLEAYLPGGRPMIREAEFAALAREVTVGETYFFRNSEQFRALAEIALPERVKANRSSRPVKLLSAGCASGEEAYTLAIVARETISDPSYEAVIRAVDINPDALEKARRARYSAWALRETPAETVEKWFRPGGREVVLDPAIRAAVRFDARNLAVEDAELWQADQLDIVFCRNVIMYFAPEQARALIARIARALRPGGYLFLGHAETLRGLSDAFHLRQTHGTFYYQLKDGGSEDAARRAPPYPAAADGVTNAAGDAWVDVIGAASARIAALAAPPRMRQHGRKAAPVPPDLTGVLQLLRRERFADGLTLLRSQVPAVSRNADALLLEAVLLSNSRLLPAAEDTCRQLLAIDELNAGAHYVLALCREAAGDCAAAAEHDRVAAHLDSGFAMPRLHLGLLARRSGDRSAGRRELADALVLLKREDASRLLLFGGGFDRDALLALCAAALRDCGAS